MPQIMRYPWDHLDLTLSAAANTTTAVVFKAGTERVSMNSVAAASRLSFDDTDKGTMGTHDYPLPVGTNLELAMPNLGMSGRSRNNTTVTIATNPADGEQYHLTVAGVEIIFEFDDGGGVTAGTTQVLLGVTAALTAAALVAAIDAEATLACTSDQNIRNTARVDILTTTDVQMSHSTTAPTKLTLGEVDQFGVVLWFASAGASTVINIQAEGE